MVSWRDGVLVGGLSLLVACAPRKEGQRYEFQGQVLAVNAARREIVIRHEDIPGFMPAMTMPFAVKDEALLEGRAPGDLVRGTLAVTDTSAWLERLTKTGFQPLETPRPVVEAGALEPNALVPEATFVDTRGKTRRFTEWRGHAVALTFIFTRCPLPDFCPALDRGFAKLQERVKGDPVLRERARLLTVSFDPEHDTPEILRKYASRLGADPEFWEFLTGEAAVVDAFGGQFGLSVARYGQDITHNLRTAAVDPSGRLVRIWRGSDWAPDEVADTLRKALDR
ncbi:MAG TPA: SCO family protein, partial [Vicinamibacteria bacterium]